MSTNLLFKEEEEKSLQEKLEAEVFWPLKCIDFPTTTLDNFFLTGKTLSL